MHIAAQCRIAGCASGNERQNWPVAGVRTLVVTLSPLLSDVVTSLLQPHLPLNVIRVLQTREQLAEHLRATVPDLVILGLLGGETDACARPLLVALPSAKILVLTRNGQHAWLHEMRPQRTALTNLSVRALVRTLASRFDVTPPQG
jgi:DNA-binding NarL/FixJ family response regulator